MRFTVPREQRAEFLREARQTVELLRGRAGCRGVDVLQSVDRDELLAITTRWDSMGSYRRALSAYEIKERVIPFLSHTLDEDSTFETLLAGSAAGIDEFHSGLAADARTTQLGSASTPAAPRLET